MYAKKKQQNNNNNNNNNGINANTIEELKKRIDELDSKNTSLEVRVVQLEENQTISSM